MTILDMLDIMSIPLSTIGVHVICKLLRRCVALRTHIFIKNSIDVTEADARVDAPRPNANARSTSTSSS